jgi:hypothetical protein
MGGTKAGRWAVSWAAKMVAPLAAQKAEPWAAAKAVQLAQR